MKKFVWILSFALLLGMLAGCQTEPTNTLPVVNTTPTSTTIPPVTEPVDIRPLPPKNPGSSLIEYDPDRQIYIASENIYVDFYIGVTNLPNITVEVYAKEYIDPEDISVALPVDLPFVVHVSQVPVQRKTEAMVSDGNIYGTMPYYVYCAYRGIHDAKEDFAALKEEDLPEFYLYDISVAFINILELDAPVTLEKIDITLGEKTYEAKLGRVRVLPKEAFPSEAQEVRRRKGFYGNGVQLYNDGLVALLDAFALENAPEDITITGLRMLEEESQILDITVVVTSGNNTVETKWDGKSPIYLYKGDRIYIDVMVKNELTAKLLNRVHLQVATEYTKDATGETVCEVTTHLGGADRKPYEYYAIIFDGVDMESYYREIFYKHNFEQIEEYRNK